jgi:ribulose-phosphate 3-epimerase
MAEGIALIEASGADWIHLDVMDGNFVPNISFGPKMVADMRPHSSLPYDVHLMILNPLDYIGEFAQAGADYITFHAEATIHSHRVLQAIHERGKMAGISIVPSTPAQAIAPLLPFVELVLVMTVNPGFGGQPVIPNVLKRSGNSRPCGSPLEREGGGISSFPWMGA